MLLKVGGGEYDDEIEDEPFQKTVCFAQVIYIPDVSRHNPSNSPLYKQSGNRWIFDFLN
jgi:hypothetical protein